MTRFNRMFSLVTDRVVYSQMWEDPEVDREFLGLRSYHRVVGIASAGCNTLTYLLDQPAEVVGVDLNRHHLALAQLKLSALRHLPTHEDFFAMFADGADPANPERYHDCLRGTLDPETQRYWDERRLGGSQRIDVFAEGLHQRSAVGRAIGAAHLWAKLNRCKMHRVLEARDLSHQREAYEREIAPLFKGALIGCLAKFPSTLYPLGIPAEQRETIRRASNEDVLGWLRGRIEHLACSHSVSDNYFAWQVFGRSYDLNKRVAIPPFLTAENYAVLRARAGRVTFRHGRLTEYLAGRDRGSVNRFVLLDAQDWMTSGEVQALWTAIDHSADPSDARVIFRTAGDLQSFVTKLVQWPMQNWRYLEAESVAATRQDRSALYGGVHIMQRL